MYRPLDELTITQPFGSSPDYYRQFGTEGHSGIDLRTRWFNLTNWSWGNLMGYQPVYAVKDGVAVAKYDNGGYGTHIYLKDNDGNEYLYAHLKNTRVVGSPEVKEGDIIGISGRTGNTTGPHLHFAYRPVNPDYNNGFYGWEDPTKLFYGPAEYRVSCITAADYKDKMESALKYVSDKLMELTGGKLKLTVTIHNIEDIRIPDAQVLPDERLIESLLKQPPTRATQWAIVAYKSTMTRPWTSTNTYANYRKIPVTKLPELGILENTLLFECKHSLGQHYNMNRDRSTMPFIPVEDEYNGSYEYVVRFINQLLPYLEVFRK